MLELTAGGDRVVVDDDRGARIVSLLAGGADRILGPSSASTKAETTWGCFPMAPFAGRVANAVFGFDSKSYELVPNLPPHAIHGVVFDESWVVEELSESYTILSCELDPGRWPLGGSVRQRLDLEPGGLVIEASVRAGDQAMPAAVGWHPWFRRPAHGDMRVEVCSEAVLETTADLVPTGSLSPVEGDLDLREGPLLRARRLDTVYTSVASPARLLWPDLELELAFGDTIDTVVVYSPPEGICVEPQTAWPNAFALAERGVTGTGITVLDAGAELKARTSWSWRLVR